jgi:PAS domain S-box-containing protein
VSHNSIDHSAGGNELKLELFHSIYDFAIFRIGVDGMLQSWNLGIERILGYTSDEWIGQHTEIAFIPEDRENGAPRRELALAAERGYVTDERWHQCKDGSRIWGVGTVRPITDEDNEIIGFVKVFQDLTDRKEQMTALEEAKLEAERATRQKDQFLSILSHELRSPLTAVFGALTVLEEMIDEQGKEFLEMIRRNVELEARLVDDLLDVARIARGKLHIAFATVDAHQLIEEIVANTWYEIKTKRIALTIELNASHFRISADRTRLQQIIWNILRNAIKFTPANGSIKIQTSNGDDQDLMISITDTGIGMSPETMERIFRPFAQASDQQSIAYGGLGLGLSISKQLVERHGGSLRAYSEGEGKGSCFEVCLPADRPDGPEVGALTL